MQIAGGTVFAGYRIERLLGAGGMGTVYLARHPRLPRLDALKVLSVEHGDDLVFRTAFLREAEVAARLRHPNLVAGRDRGEYRGRLWIAMQYVPGRDLSQVIVPGRGIGDPERAVRVLWEAAQGLDELHAAGLLHRDVKPGNILLAEQPDRPERVLVTDYGIARRVEDWTTLNAGGFTGTLAYAAPEQIETSRIDHRVDVYALGCTLFQMLTGSVPFPRDSAGGLITAHLTEPPPRPSVVNPGVPPAFDAVIARALAKDPDERYGSCGELAVAARAALVGTAETVPRPRAATDRHVTRNRLWRSRNGRRSLSMGVAATLVAALAATAVIVLRGGGGESGAGKPEAAPNTPVTGTIDPVEWGVYAYIAEALPNLLPATPEGIGYQGLSGCAATDENYNELSFGHQVAQNFLMCAGDSDPAYLIYVVCNADRSPISPDPAAVPTEGTERWSRASGSGTLSWGFGKTSADAGTGETVFERATGVLELYFDDPARNFCRLQIHGGGNSGAELRARWWQDAPL
ncbi:serine/threonine-protein kinase [Nocardia inohanensis]|uniref:serine/threonine-protein kinase n=1 Tax=Nocardia inohanensis TaxID=209246 RepID=UPI000834EFF9|nr:serine/threonine-protein kinase [Nocardia inohanensis]